MRLTTLSAAALGLPTVAFAAPLVTTGPEATLTRGPKFNTPHPNLPSAFVIPPTHASAALAQPSVTASGIPRKFLPADFPADEAVALLELIRLDPNVPPPWEEDAPIRKHPHERVELVPNALERIRPAGPLEGPLKDRPPTRYPFVDRIRPWYAPNIDADLERELESIITDAKATQYDLHSPAPAPTAAPLLDDEINYRDPEGIALPLPVDQDSDSDSDSETDDWDSDFEALFKWPFHRPKGPFPRHPTPTDSLSPWFMMPPSPFPSPTPTPKSFVKNHRSAV